MIEKLNVKLFSNEQKERIISRFGKALFDRAVYCIDMYMEKWQLSDLNLIEFFSSNLLLNCFSQTYGSSVLKIQLDNSNMNNEITELRLFEGRRFCQVYEYSAEDGVCLLEKISPGETLFNGTTREERIQYFCDLYDGLHIIHTESPLFLTYLNWLEEGERGVKQRGDCTSMLPYVQKAKEIILSINAMYTRTLLLHGDLHYENILKNQNGDYTIIDPKGVIGDPVYDISRFILDEFHDDLTSEPVENIINFVRSISEKLSIPTEILLQCLYAETVIWLCGEELASGVSIENCAWLICNMKVAEKLLTI